MLVNPGIYFIQLYLNPGEGRTIRCIDGICNIRSSTERIKFAPDKKAKNQPVVENANNKGNQPVAPETNVAPSLGKDGFNNESKLAQEENVSSKTLEKASSNNAEASVFSDGNQHFESIEPSPPQHSPNTRELHIFNPSSILLISGSILLCIFTCKWISRSRLKSLVTRANTLLNEENTEFFYCTKTKVARVLGFNLKNNSKIFVELEQLEYSRNANAKTLSFHHESELFKNDFGLKKNLLWSKPKLLLPDVIKIKCESWKKVEPDSQYQELVKKHHYYWGKLTDALDFKNMLSQKLLDTDHNSRKYDEIEGLAEFTRKIEDIKSQLKGYMGENDRLIAKLYSIIEKLSILIESIEDFGGVLIGYENPEEYLMPLNKIGQYGVLEEIEADEELLVNGIDSLMDVQGRWAAIDDELDAIRS